MVWAACLLNTEAMRAGLLMAVAVLLLPRMRGQQPVTFDTARMNVAGIFSVGHSVFEHPDGYLAFSIQTGLDTFGQDLFSTRFDGSGGVLTETSFKTYQADFAGFSSPVQSATSGYYVGMNRFGVIGPLDSLFLYRFNGDGDTLWTRFIAVDTTYTMRGTFVRNNDDVLLTGLHQYPEETYIYHLDSLGNSKGYHGYPGFDGEDVVEGYRLTVPVEERTVVDPTFATRDLMRALAAHPPVRVLALAADGARLFLAAPDHLTEVE